MTIIIRAIKEAEKVLIYVVLCYNTSVALWHSWKFSSAVVISNWVNGVVISSPQMLPQLIVMAESTPPPTHPSPLVCLRFIIVSESQGVQYCSYRYREITNDETLIKPTTDEDKLFFKAQASSFSFVRKSLKIIKCYAKLFILKKLLWFAS